MHSPAVVLFAGASQGVGTTAAGCAFAAAYRSQYLNVQTVLLGGADGHVALQHQQQLYTEAAGGRACLVVDPWLLPGQDAWVSYLEHASRSCDVLLVDWTGTAVLPEAAGKSLACGSALGQAANSASSDFNSSSSSRFKGLLSADLLRTADLLGSAIVLVVDSMSDSAQLIHLLQPLQPMSTLASSVAVESVTPALGMAQQPGSSATASAEVAAHASLFVVCNRMATGMVSRGEFQDALEAAGLPAQVVACLPTVAQAPVGSSRQQQQQQLLDELQRSVVSHADTQALLCTGKHSRSNQKQQALALLHSSRLSVLPTLLTAPELSPPVRIAVAYDLAFHPHFTENLTLLRELGAELLFFSPLSDTTLPAGVSGLYLSGPDAGSAYSSHRLGSSMAVAGLDAEDLCAQLSDNAPMLASIQAFCTAGGVVYGEGLGLSYLCQSLELGGRHLHGMVGHFPFRARMAPGKPQRGQVTLTVLDGCPLFPAGTIARGYFDSCAEMMEERALSSLVSAALVQPPPQLGNGLADTAVVAADGAAGPKYAHTYHAYLRGTASLSVAAATVAAASSMPCTHASPKRTLAAAADSANSSTAASSQATPILEGYSCGSVLASLIHTFMPGASSLAISLIQKCQAVDVAAVAHAAAAAATAAEAEQQHRREVQEQRELQRRLQQQLHSSPHHSPAIQPHDLYHQQLQGQDVASRLSFQQHSSTGMVAGAWASPERQQESCPQSLQPMAYSNSSPYSAEPLPPSPTPGTITHDHNNSGRSHHQTAGHLDAATTHRGCVSLDAGGLLAAQQQHLQQQLHSMQQHAALPTQTAGADGTHVVHNGNGLFAAVPPHSHQASLRPPVEPKALAAARLHLSASMPSLLQLQQQLLRRPPHSVLLRGGSNGNLMHASGSSNCLVASAQQYQGNHTAMPAGTPGSSTVAQTDSTLQHPFGMCSTASAFPSGLPGASGTARVSSESCLMAHTHRSYSSSMPRASVDELQLSMHRGASGLVEAGRPRAYRASHDSVCVGGVRCDSDSPAWFPTTTNLRTARASQSHPVPLTDAASHSGFQSSFSGKAMGSPSPVKQLHTAKQPTSLGSPAIDTPTAVATSYSASGLPLRPYSTITPSVQPHYASTLPGMHPSRSQMLYHNIALGVSDSLVSFHPGAARILHKMGLGARIAGVSEDCQSTTAANQTTQSMAAHSHNRSSTTGTALATGRGSSLTHSDSGGSSELPRPVLCFSRARLLAASIAAAAAAGPNSGNQHGSNTSLAFLSSFFSTHHSHLHHRPPPHLPSTTKLSDSSATVANTAGLAPGGPGIVAATGDSTSGISSLFSASVVSLGAEAAAAEALHERGEASISVDEQALRELQPMLLVLPDLASMHPLDVAVLQQALYNSGLLWQEPGATTVLHPSLLRTLFDVLAFIHSLGRAAAAPQLATSLVDRLQARLRRVAANAATASTAAFTATRAAAAAAAQQASVAARSGARLAHAGRTLSPQPSPPPAASLAAGGMPVVLVLEGVLPFVMAGRWVPEMVQLAGGYSPLNAEGGDLATPLTWEQIRTAAPSILIISTNLARSSDLAKLAEVAALPGWWQLPAVRSSRVYVMDEVLMSHPGLGLVDGVEALGKMVGEAIACGSCGSVGGSSREPVGGGDGAVPAQVQVVDRLQQALGLSPRLLGGESGSSVNQQRQQCVGGVSTGVSRAAEGPILKLGLLPGQRCRYSHVPAYFCAWP